MMKLFSLYCLMSFDLSPRDAVALRHETPLPLFGITAVALLPKFRHHERLAVVARDQLVGTLKAFTSSEAHIGVAPFEPAAKR